MNYNIIPTDHFKKESKRLVKKYPSLKNELIELNQQLEENPELGVRTGNQIFKVRLAIKSKGKGKSGGARVITYLITEKKELYLLSIYDKSEIEIISDRELDRVIKNISI